jgi:hypothetical protein
VPVRLPLNITTGTRVHRKDPKAMARFKLDMEPDPEIEVIGISSHVKDYRLCWSINRVMEIGLKRRRTPIEEDLNGRSATYTVYDHVNEETGTSCTLVNNHGSEGVLLRDLKQADYFLILHREWPDPPDEVLRKLRAAEFVLTAFPLPFGQLREGHKLLL